MTPADLRDLYVGVAECLVAVGAVTLALLIAHAAVCWAHGEWDEWRWFSLSRRIGDRLAHERPSERWTAEEVMRERARR